MTHRTPAPTLRPAGPTDAGALARLHTARFARPWPAADMATLLADPIVFGLLAEAAGTPVGFILCRAAAGEAEILTVAMDEGHARRGTATRLVEAAASEAARRGAATLFLEVASGNDAARALYRRTGFNERGRRARYYGSGTGDDALILSRGLALVSGRGAG